jgi:hypothetical protein
MVRRLAVEGRASERQVRGLLDLARQKVESTASLVLVHPETREYIIDYCVWAFYCKSPSSILIHKLTIQGLAMPTSPSQASTHTR